MGASESVNHFTLSFNGNTSARLQIGRVHQVFLRFIISITAKIPIKRLGTNVIGPSAPTKKPMKMARGVGHIETDELNSRFFLLSTSHAMAEPIQPSKSQTAICVVITVIPH
jgi:hypothetical protein